MLFIYAANDFSVAPGEVLDAEMARLETPHRLRVFPSFGRTALEGHQFVYLAPASWESEVFAFLDQHMKP